MFLLVLAQMVTDNQLPGIGIWTENVAHMLPKPCPFLDSVNFLRLVISNNIGGAAGIEPASERTFPVAIMFVCH